MNPALFTIPQHHQILTACSEQVQALRRGMHLKGVDWWHLAGMTSCEHTAADIAKTVKAMEWTMWRMKDEGSI